LIEGHLLLLSITSLLLLSWHQRFVQIELGLRNGAGLRRRRCRIVSASEHAYQADSPVTIHIRIRYFPDSLTR